MEGSFIDSMKTLAGYDDAYVQLAFFEYQSQQYAYIVNRRVDDGTYGQVDSQTVRLYLADSLGRYQVWDVYANTCDTIWDSCGVLKYDLYLDPGEGKLVKTVCLNGSTWCGSLASDWTWPPFATINIRGDLTIPTTKTLTIKTSQINIPALYDTLHTNDTNATEIIVYGEVRVEGTADNRVVLAPNSSCDTAWGGIRVPYGYSGKIYIDNAIIKNAYKGVQAEADTIPDTIINSRFQNCRVMGIFTRDNAYIANDTFLSMPNGYGVYSNTQNSSRTIKDCFFREVKYPIYCWWSSPVIDDCFFIADTNRAGTGQPAVWLWRESDAEVVSCYISNYNQGIKVDFLSSPYIHACSFGSDSLTSTGDMPYMTVGILGNGLYSSAEVRQCCFEEIREKHIYSTKTVFDLGTASENGNNAFYIDSVWDGKDWNTKYPPYAVYNAISDTIQAVGNWWASSSIRSTWNYGPVVDTGALSTEPTGCQYGNPSIPKAEVTTTIAEATLPEEFSLFQNYPNPFNPVTQIVFSLPENVFVKLEVFNLLGQKIQTLINQEMPAGVHQVEWNCSSRDGERLSSGIYLYRIEAGSYVETKKMLLLK